MAALWKSFSVIAIFLALQHIRGALGTDNRPALDVTRLFYFEANSTCGGEPPTLFEMRSGELQNCSMNEYNESFAVDGNRKTRWQSQNEDDPVALTFSVIEVLKSGRVCPRS